MKVGLKKLQCLCATRWWKTHDPTIISFESIPACYGQTDTSPMPMSRYSIAERDENAYAAETTNKSIIYMLT